MSLHLQLLPHLTQMTVLLLLVLPPEAHGFGVESDQVFVSGYNLFQFEFLPV